MMLIQIPVFIGLYYVVTHISSGEVPTTWIYSFFTGFGGQYIDPANINHNFL
jgi:membrane protein insertase Oxa1/YidC/SpoIIIJ